ncbi:hypothetical protein ACFQU7_30085 [Pseudoroseomonas wenyumeiae]
MRRPAVRPPPDCDKGHDSDRFRQALTARGIEACMPSRHGRKRRIPHDRKLYR